mmetsp:Transcript_80633/g.261275  ORF Transcript_80633/g.261275 Transcript_80633/m.261275 type:complete len:798 (+) Transcript_80633:120-2513(+)
MWRVFALAAIIWPRAHGLDAQSGVWRMEGQLLFSSLRGFGSSQAILPTRNSAIKITAVEGEKRAPIFTGSTKEPSDAEKPEPSGPNKSAADRSKDFRIFGWTLHHVAGAFVFCAYGAVIAMTIPIVRRERKQFDEYISGGRETFPDYLKYRFTDWFTTSDSAPSVVLIFLAVGLIVTGAILYALVVGESPSHALWRIFVWASASPAENEVTPAGRMLGIMVTVCGMVILSLLFGIVSEIFASKMAEAKTGLMKVVEGGHCVILGCTDCTRCLIEELAKAKESNGGGTFVILAPGSKEELEHMFLSSHTDLRGSRVIIRSGNPVYVRDLEKVSVQSASQVVVLADSDCSPEEADAKTIRTLLALKGQNWPPKGRLIVQCANPANRHLLEKLYKADVVVVGNIVTKLMAQSSNQPGLANVFSMMLGFDGDEFYSKEWPELVGMSFKQVVFRFPEAVVLGVFTADGECILNPGWDYQVQVGDHLVVLAEDDDAYTFNKDPYYWKEGVDTPRRRAFVKQPTLHAQLGNVQDDHPSKVLIIGWNDNIGPLLNNLDGMVGDGSTVRIYSPEPEADRKAAIENLAQQWAPGAGFASFTITHAEVDDDVVSSQVELKVLRHQDYDKVFVLTEGNDRDSGDQRTVAILTQLQNIHDMLPESEKTRRFCPVVEMCEDSTKEHLKLCNLTNVIHSSSLVSQALAAVTEDAKVNGIYADLMSGREHTFDIRSFQQLLPGETEPKELSFAEAAWKLSIVGDISLIAWSRFCGDGHISWQMNPYDKVTPRPWTPNDRLVVLRRFKERGSSD